nr:MAG TPA: hypothetical protein [Caudoviricetes sp.]
MPRAVARGGDPIRGRSYVPFPIRRNSAEGEEVSQER